MAAGQNPKIVVSYRRTDSAMAGRIFDRLVQHFGKTSLFIDIDNVPFGVDFRKHIDDALQASDLLIAIIGQKWLGPQARGKLRIMNEADPVRVELETALRRDIIILPVLLDGTSMPETADLPETIRDFAYRNALEVESGRDFNVHIDRLIHAIEQTLGVRSKLTTGEASALLSPAPAMKNWHKPLTLGLAGLLIAAGLGAAVWYWTRGDLLGKTETTKPPAFPEFCDDLKRVIAEGRATRFNSILGRDDGNGWWTANIQLPGWYDCWIHDYIPEGQTETKRYYSCTLPAFTNAAAVRAKTEAMTAYLKPCLGPEWGERRATYSDQTISVFYERGQHDPVVQLREAYHEDRKDWALRFDVDAPAQAAAAN